MFGQLEKERDDGSSPSLIGGEFDYELWQQVDEDEDGVEKEEKDDSFYSKEQQLMIKRYKFFGSILGFLCGVGIQISNAKAIMFVQYLIDKYNDDGGDYDDNSSSSHHHTYFQNAVVIMTIIFWTCFNLAMAIIIYLHYVGRLSSSLDHLEATRKHNNNNNNKNLLQQKEEEDTKNQEEEEEKEILMGRIEIGFMLGILFADFCIEWAISYLSQSQSESATWHPDGSSWIFINLPNRLVYDVVIALAYYLFWRFSQIRSTRASTSDATKGEEEEEDDDGSKSSEYLLMHAV